MSNGEGDRQAGDERGVFNGACTALCTKAQADVLFSEKIKPTDIVTCYYDCHRVTNKANNYSQIFVSTPNADWCPVFKSFKSPVLVRQDGTFGWDDPVCWPQNYHSGAPHIPCIPIFDPDECSPIYLFRHGLIKDHVTFTDFWEGNLQTGRISRDFTRDLEAAVSRTTNRARTFLSTASGSHP